MKKCIAIANQKGGVGKTTLCVNLAYNLGIAGFKVLLIDIDTQGNATSSLGATKSNQGGIYRFLTTGKYYPEEIVSLFDGQLQLIPASAALRDFETQSGDDHQHQLKKSFKDHLDQWDFILFDCPPSLGLLTSNALALANDLLIPVQVEFLAMEGLVQMVEAQKKIKQEINDQLSIQGIVLNMAQHDQELSQAVESEVRKYFGELVFNSVVPRDVVLAEAPSHGQPVLEYAPRSRGGLAMIEVARELMKKSNL